MSEGQGELAERYALAIPHIAVALSDAGLQSSRVSYRDWCARWVHPNHGAEVYEQWCIRSGEFEQNENGVPFEALRALRLRRKAREVHTRFPPGESTMDMSNGQALTCALLGAEFRWYEQEGRYQPIVRTNIARLGVLR